MITGREYVTPLARVCLGGSFLLLVCAIVLWNVEPPAKLIQTEPLKGLQSELEQLQPYADAKLQEKRARKQELQKMLWTDERYTAFMTQLKAEWDKKKPVAKWKLQDVYQGDGNFAVTHRYVLTLDKALAGDWPAIYTVLTKLDAEPGIIVRGLTLAMPRESRHFDQVQVIFSIPFQKK